MRIKVGKMKAKPKSIILILIVLGIMFALSPIISNGLNFNAGNSNESSNHRDDINLDNENLKLSAVSGRIHIDNNWSDAKTAGICTGSGNYTHPYVIEDLIIDGGGSGSCILIENSDAYFIVRNCSLYNSSSSSDNAGIKLYNVYNGKIINNNCSNNIGCGIYLYNSDNNTISGNTANNNYYGIYLFSYSNDNTISGNTANNNVIGIFLCYSHNNTLSGNLMNFCGICLYGTLADMASHSIDDTNLVNSKPVYYYVNEIGLGSSNFTGPGQIILINCNNSIISGFNLSNSSTGIFLGFSNNNTLSGNNASNNGGGIYFGCGIYLYVCDNNTISGNTVNNNDDHGIYLVASDNNTISGNTANNNYYGINLYDCDNNTVSGNTANNNYYGIMLFYSDNNTFSGNSANSNWYGIHLYNSNNNTLSGNTASNNNSYAIYIRESDNNTITGNFINNNNHGIYLWISDNNTLSGNTASNNNFYAIYIRESDNNTVSGNTASNGLYGIYLMSGNNNKIFLNSISSNGISAEDNGINNRWDNGTVGNYWDDYSGKDANDDGIGDTPYNIPGSASSQDNYPIFWDAPVFSVNSPSQNDYFSINSPNFDISIEEGVVNLMWYTLDGGIVNKTFTGLTGTISQTIWDSISEGDVTIRFYVNDSADNIAFEEVTINKDTTAPIITINSPSTDEIFGNNAPGYNLTIIESNIHTMWYTLDSGTTNFTFTGLTGTIDQALWDSTSDGAVTIRFSVNDSAGNIAFEEVSINKDATAPIITINSPSTNEIFGINAPGYNLTITESNIHTMWYTLDSGTTNFTFTGLTGTIGQATWDSISEGSVTIRFYVNDSAGNISFEEIEVIKRIPEEAWIPGYNLFFLFGVLSVVAIIISIKLKKFNT